MTDREKLVELVEESFADQHDRRRMLTVPDTVNYLIANGVVVREKGEWIDWAKFHGVVFFHHGIRSAGVVCSLCNKLSDNKYDFCPNCGADMRGAVNNG